MALELKMEDKPWYYALGIGLLFGAIMAGIVQYAWFRNLNQEIAKGRAAERKLSQFREEVKRLELELSKLLQILPSKRNTEELIKRIETLTRQGDFTLKTFKPGDFVQKDFYAEWPIQIAIDGTYHNLALFFDRMSRFSRIINVEDLKVNTLDSSPGKSIQANFVAKTFIYTGDEIGQATAAEGAAPGSLPPPPASKAPAPAAKSAESLKGRAEGRGAE